MPMSLLAVPAQIDSTQIDLVPGCESQSKIMILFQGVKVLFLLGGQKEGKEDMLLENQIQKEWKHSRDLVREDFVDSYQVTRSS